MKRDSIVWLVGLAAITANGCVMKSTYSAALAELEATRTEVETAKTQQQMLAQQVRTLEADTQELTRSAEIAAAAVQQAKEAAEAEQRMSDEAIAKLRRTVAQLTASQNSLRHALDVAQRDSAALKSTAEMYKTKLNDGEGFRTPSFPPPPLPPNSEPGGTPGSIPSAPQQASSEPVPAPALTPPVASPDTSPAMPRSVPKQPSEPADEGFFAAIKDWLLSLWRSLFS